MKKNFAKFSFNLIFSMAALLLIVVGVLSGLKIYQKFSDRMIDYESKSLNSNLVVRAEHIDRMFDELNTQIGLFVNHNSLKDAEEAYYATGDTSSLYATLSENELLRENVSVLFEVEDDSNEKICVAEEFPSDLIAEEFLGPDLSLYYDSREQFWFVTGASSLSGLKYRFAVPAESLFSYNDNISNSDPDSDVFFFLLETELEMEVYSTKKLSDEQGRENEVSDRNYYSTSKQLTDLFFDSIIPSGKKYDVVNIRWDDHAKGSRSLVMCYPLKTGGGNLVLGSGIKLEQIDQFLDQMLKEILLVVSAVVAGFLFMGIIVLRYHFKYQKKTLELEAISEKAEIMEELNREHAARSHEERLVQLGAMTSGIVHEFNNMLTPIMGQSHLLLEQLADQEDSPQFEYALDIFESAEKARDVLRRMALISRKDPENDFKVLDLGLLLEKTMNLVAMAKDSHIRIELQKPENPLFVFGNEQMLTQMFMNLCINACQAMGTEGTLTVHAEHEYSSAAHYVRVEVRDTGPGIPPDIIDSIFERFFTTKGEHGTGLGLAISKEIVEAHKGTIKAADNQPHGAVFTVRIPAYELEDDE